MKRYEPHQKKGVVERYAVVQNTAQKKPGYGAQYGIQQAVGVLLDVAGIHGRRRVHRGRRPVHGRNSAGRDMAPRRRRMRMVPGVWVGMAVRRQTRWRLRVRVRNGRRMQEKP